MLKRKALQQYKDFINGKKKVAVNRVLRNAQRLFLHLGRQGEDS